MSSPEAPSSKADHGTDITVVEDLRISTGPAEASVAIVLTIPNNCYDNSIYAISMLVSTLPLESATITCR